MDGDKEQPPAPGVEKVFPGPYSSYLTDYTIKSMVEQHKFILQVVNEEGERDIGTNSCLHKIIDVTRSL